MGADPLLDGTDWGYALWVIESPDDPRLWQDVPLREQTDLRTRAFEILAPAVPKLET